MTLLRIEGIGKRFGTVAALEDINLDVAAGTRTAIVGPSGSGKTTLLRVIAGFETPERGRVLLDGRVLADGPMTVPAHRRAVGFVFQDGALFPHLSVADNIGFGLPDMAGEERRDRIAALMRMVDLGPHLGTRKPHQLSGGQQQRVALARALALKPRVMLLDEPFSALDTGLRAATRKAVEHLLSAAGIATILVTHDESEALSFADQIAIMREGRLVQSGPPEDIYWHPRDRGIAELLGEALILPAEISGGVARCILGPVPVAQPAAPGLGTIMLRHEQVALLPDPAGGQGRVLELEFGGFASTAVVSLQGAACPAGTEQIMTFRCTNTTHLEVGSGVSFTVTGSAHVLA